MKGIQYIVASLVSLSAFSLSAEAQDLNKVIIIDQEVEPELGEVSKINVAPQIPPLNISTTKLSYNDKAKTSSVSPLLTMLEPAENIDTIMLSKYRGYAALGYFPIYNLGLSAGYRFIDKEDIKLGAWLQYNGKSYDATASDDSELSICDHELSLNADYAQRINRTSILGVGVGYTFNSFSYPWLKDYTQTVNQFDFDADWNSSFEGLKYNIGVGYDYFGYSKESTIKEHAGYIEAGACLELDDDEKVALDFGAKMIHDNYLFDMSTGVAESPYNHAILTLTPHYDFKYANIKARVGIQFDYQIDIDDEFNISPDVYLDWAAMSKVSAYAHFTGGVHHNSMGSIFDESHYFLPIVSYVNSKMPCVIDAGVNIGPFKNATFELFGGYARANDWYMPAFEDGISIMEAVDFDGWHIGVAASYNYKGIAKVRASYEAAPQSYDDGYYLWRDRAKYVVKASAVVTPIAPLDITLDYEYRGSRRTYEKVGEFDGENNYIYINQCKSLGHVSNLSIGGIYRYTDQISFFARLENILNHKYDLLYNIPSQGFTGLVGATYKF